MLKNIFKKIIPNRVYIRWNITCKIKKINEYNFLKNYIKYLIKLYINMYKSVLTYRGMVRLIINNKKILLIMPVNNIPSAINKLRLVTEQLENQHYLIIYVDNASQTVARSLLIFEKKYKNITIMYSLKKQKLIESWNKPLQIGIELLNPKYFCWVSDHDKISNNYFRRIEKLTEIYNDADLVFVTKNNSSFNYDNEDKIKILYYDEMKKTSRLYGKIIYGMFKINHRIYNENFQIMLRKSLYPDIIFIDSILIQGGYALVEFNSKEGIEFDDEILKNSLSKIEFQKRQLKNLFKEEYSIEEAIIFSLDAILKNINLRWCVLSDQKRISYLNLMFKKITNSYINE